DSVFPVHRAGIPTNIRNTNAPEQRGTMISHGAVEEKNPYIITGIAGKSGFSVVSVEKAMMNSERGFGRRVLQAIEESGLSFEHLPTGIDTMCVVLATAELEPVKERVVKRIMELTTPDSLTINDDMGIIATVGRGMVHNPGTAARLFSALSREHVNVRMIDQGSSELSILVGVDNGDFHAAIRAIYQEFVKD
ncbi:MAG: ACT domain-containing protein, partial [Clostridia bacterium]